MRAAHVAEIVTPKRYVLNGLWYGTRRPHTVYIWVHGLTGSAFSGKNIIHELAKQGAAGLVFNTRGYGHINEIKRKRGKKWVYETGGTAFEKFTDCIDDIQGAVNIGRRSGAKNVVLLGHSTGCQKSIYWAARGKKGVTGIVLLGPLSDYADTLVPAKRRLYASGLAYARKMVRSGRGAELMPKKFTQWLFLSAERFLSLYTPASAEEIFTYVQPSKSPTTLRKVRVPTLALLAEKDEFSDIPAYSLYDWFLENIYEGEVAIVPKVGHSFAGAEKHIASLIRRFVHSYA